MIYTFYSYKGGVGRSMALANIAEIFYQEGFKVLMVDWDLEAPGLERFFPVRPDEVLQNPGVLDMLQEYKTRMADAELPEDKELFPDIAPYLVDVYPEGNGIGRLWLMPSGNRFKEHFADYAHLVRTFDWQDFYKNWEGELYFEWLRERFQNQADVVLIDSRTGVTEIGGVCTYQFADVVVMFCAPNQQNIEGLAEMSRNFVKPEIEEFRKGRPLNILAIPARIEDRAETWLLNDFRQQFLDQFGALHPAQLGGRIEQLWDLRIPYVPFYAFNEVVAVRDKGELRSEDLNKAYNTLQAALKKLGAFPGADQTSSKEWRNHLYFPAPIREEVNLLGREEEIAQIESNFISRRSTLIIIQGERKIGKTSLLNVLTKRMTRAKKPHMVPISLVQQGISSFAEFANAILELIAYHFSSTHSKIVIGLEFSPVNTVTQFSITLERMLKTAPQTFFFLCVDDFDEILHRLDQLEQAKIVGMINYLLENLDQPFGMCFTVTHLEDLLMEENASPFYTRAFIVNLKPFASEDLSQYILTLSGSTLSWTDETLKEFCDLCGGSPFLAKLLLLNLIEFGNPSRLPFLVTPATLTRATERAVSDSSGNLYFENLYKTQMSDSQRAIALYLTARKSSISNSELVHLGSSWLTEARRMAKRNFLRETVAGFEFNAKMTTSWFTGWELYEEELEKITKLFSILSPLVEIEVDTTTGQVRVMGVPVRLSAQEFAIMDFLSERSGQLVHREELVERIWETDQGVSDQVIDTAFYRLRKKIGDQGQYIETIPGQGFCLHRAIRINEGNMARNRW